MGAILRAFASGRMLCVFFYGISSGLPLLLIGGTLKAWLKERQIDLTTIGLFSLTQIPYTVKFLWSPLMDRYVPPFLGRRRGWILITQLGLAAALAGMAMLDPGKPTWQFSLGGSAQMPGALALISLLVAFLSASQDIAIDAYRRDILTTEELGLGSSLAVNGYRVGLLIAGAGALALADHASWNTVYLCMAGVMILGTVTTLLSPEPETKLAPPKTLTAAVVEPFKNFFTRPHAVEILIFILLFKIGDSMASDMFNPFYLDLGYSKTEIAAIAKLFGFWATIGGGLIGGAAMVRLGMIPSLWIFGISQTVSTFGFSVLARSATSIPLLTSVVVFENLCTGMATSAYVGFMASLCNKRFTATQYALLSSLMGIPRSILGSSSGYLAKHMGWWGYYVFCTMLHLPGLLMLLRVQTFYHPEEDAA